MDSLWAPWRIEYIRAEKEQGCFLCDAFTRREDRQRLVLARGAACGVVLNKYPYNPGHLMVCPYRHVATLEELTPAEWAEMQRLTVQSLAALGQVMKPHGYNTGINLGQVAGAGLQDHIHMHVVPRWSGDTNFMPVLGATKVMPQALDDLWQELAAAFPKGA